ncbi:MAG TPA: M2 family metallopeptidase [Gemmatimonadales bacterium]|nr:M2 family metallopeptidase [Gemmatimonadales bacterium]
MPLFRPVVGLSLALALALPASLAAQARARAHAARPTVAEARRFIDAAERELAVRSVPVNRAAWLADNFITDDTESLSAYFQTDFGIAVRRLATAAARFDAVAMPAELRRRFVLLKLQLAAPPPADSAQAAEMTTLQVGMQGDYGKGTYCRPGRDGGGQECLQINAIENIMAASRDPAELLDVWQGWHRVGAPMRDRFARFVALSNLGARTLGFADAGQMWRAGYDMSPDSLVRVVEALWVQVRPLYVALHAYVRRRLVEKYGAAVVPPAGPIPAHLLGNLWAQDWTNVYPLVAPADVPPTYDLNERLRARHFDALAMVRTGERFFLSLGFDSLPATFWERSLFVQPRDREAVCHASAWDIDNQNDLRIKMCIQPTGEDLVTIHHELGHNFYQRAYDGQPYLYEAGANDGFHEAIGDAIALSVTPDYLHRIGLIDTVPGAASDTALLLMRALDKVAFLPFGLLVDEWRWKVFAGEVGPADYNRLWWDLRLRYQGVAAPAPRAAAAFDPGAKFHVPANVPYLRYFLANILQFQFYRAMCQAAGYTGPLYRCSVYGSREAGRRFAAMLALGASRPWPEALEQLTGTRTMDAGALLEYFAPLKAWLDRQNAGSPVGW